MAPALLKQTELLYQVTLGRKKKLLDKKTILREKEFLVVLPETGVL